MCLIFYIVWKYIYTIIIMNLTVKTLKGGKFTVEVEASNTVAEVKTVIVSYDVVSFYY